MPTRSLSWYVEEVRERHGGVTRRYDLVTIVAQPAATPQVVILPKYGREIRVQHGYDATGCPAYVNDCDARGHVSIEVQPSGGGAKKYSDVKLCFLPLAVALPPGGGRIRVKAIYGYRNVLSQNPPFALLPPVPREQRPRSLLLEVNDEYRAWLAMHCVGSRAEKIAMEKLARIGRGAPVRAPIVIDGEITVSEKMPVTGATVNIAAMPVVVVQVKPLRRLDLATASCEVTHLGAEVEICADGRCVRKKTVPMSVWDNGPAKVVKVNMGKVSARMRPLGFTDKATDEHGVDEHGVPVWDGGASKRLAAGVFFSTARPVPAKLPARIRMCLGESASIPVHAYVKTRIVIPHLGVDTVVEPGMGAVRVDYRAALAAARNRVARVKAVLAALEGHVYRSIIDRGARLYSVEGDIVYIAPAVRLRKTRPTLEQVLGIEILAPALSATIDAPRFLEPLEKGLARLVVANTGTCRGRFLAELLGERVEKILSPREKIEIKKSIEMHVGDITVEARAELDTPAGRDTWRRTVTVRMINTVWLHDGRLEARGGAEKNRVKIGVAGLAVRPRHAAVSVLKDVPVPAAVAEVDIGPHEVVDLASVTMPQAVVIMAEKPIWLAVDDRPVKRDTKIVWYSGPAGQAAAAMLEKALMAMG